METPLENFIEEFGEQISRLGKARIRAEYKLLRKAAVKAKKVSTTISNLQTLGANLDLAEDNDATETFTALNDALQNLNDIGVSTEHDSEL